MKLSSQLITLVTFFFSATSGLVAANRLGGESHKARKLSDKEFDELPNIKLFQLDFEQDTTFFGFKFWICFSSHSTAEVKGRGKVQMSEIEVGDEVLTGNGSYETIYTIDHRHPTKSAEFLQIFYDSLGEEADKPLELSKKHMLFVDGNPNPIPADSIKVGQHLQTRYGSREIKEISTITRKGVFNPLTKSGTIVVNGVIASVYSAFFSNNEWVQIAGHNIMTHESFFSKALKPLRTICDHVSIELCKTNSEKIMVSEIAANLHKYWSQQTSSFQAVSLSSVLALLTMVDFVSNLFFVRVALCAISILCLSALNKNRKISCGKKD